MIKAMTNGVLAYNNGHLYYETVGSGAGDPIVFVHGFTLDRRMWQPQVGHFSKNHQVVTYDARGFGKSSLPGESYSHTTDLHALFNHVGIQQAHVVGLSMGGRIATNFTLAYPNLVKSLTLMDAALDGYPKKWIGTCTPKSKVSKRQKKIGSTTPSSLLLESGLR